MVSLPVVEPGSFDDVIRRRSRIILRALWLASLVVGATLWVGWQNEQRTFMGMPLFGEESEP